MAQLVFIDGKNMGSSLMLNDRTSVGRLPENGVSLPHPSVSDRHATIMRTESGWRLARTSSASRVTVNGKEVAEQILRHGDVLTFGQMTLVFNDETAAPGPGSDVKVPGIDDSSRFVYRKRHVEKAEDAVNTIRKSRKATDHLETLYRVGADLNAMIRLSDLSERLITHLVGAFKADRCFFLLQDARGRLEVRSERINEASRQKGSVKLSRTILAEAVDHREAIRVEDALADPRVSDVESIRQLQIQSALCAPMVKGDRIIGALLLDTVSVKRPWTDDDLHLLDAIAAQAATAIETLQHLEREVHFGRVLMRLGESARKLTSSLSGDTVLTEAVSQACTIFECSKASVMLADPSGAHLSVAASNCIERSVWQNVKILPGQGFAGRVFQEGRSLLVADAPTSAEQRGYQSSSFVIAPIFAGGDKPLGVLSITDKLNKGPFSARDEELLKVFASQAGIAFSNARLYERATTDALTRLANRHHFDHRLDEAVAEHGKAGKPLSLFMCDLDHFKQKNDVYGHPVGDRILVEASTLIKNRVGTQGLVGRYGGEEFIVFLPGIPPSSAREIAEDARRAVEEFAFNAPEQPIRCTISMGVAGLMPDEKPGSLIKRADTALYSAKHTGRNKVEVAPDPAPPPA
jgi:diguanylate cyclase (GGDEF)-like protein